MDEVTLLALAMLCAPQVEPGTTRALVATESGANPYAIGVVGGTLERQPHGRAEAIATARALQANGWNFSLGLAQVNRHNLDRLALTVEDAFEPCTNLAAMQTILAECFDRASRHAGGPPSDPQRTLRQALSCYYSGDFTTGFRHGYVRRVVTIATQHPPSQPTRKETP